MEELQISWEIERLEDLVAEQLPTGVLEVGLWDGATLARWNRLCPNVVGIDREIRAPVWEIDGVHLIEGDCADPAVIQQAAEQGPYDLVFVDADHSYEAGRRDFDNYWPLVADGGMYALHDIRRYEHGDLDRLWAELRDMGRPTIEFHHRLHDWGGIGVLWK